VIASGGQCKRVARQSRKLPRNRSDFPDGNAHFLDKLQLQNWADFREQGERGRTEIGRAARINNQVGEFVRGDIRAMGAFTVANIKLASVAI
jgi:hypothetical protein